MLSNILGIMLIIYKLVNTTNIISRQQRLQMKGMSGMQIIKNQGGNYSYIK